MPELRPTLAAAAAVALLLLAAPPLPTAAADLVARDAGAGLPPVVLDLTGCWLMGSSSGQLHAHLAAQR